MCGIVAIFTTEGQVSAPALAAATRALHHRGPDGEGLWIAPHGRVGLGHRRLSIIDLETGDQPIANEDGSKRIVVNGELYDHERVRRELEARGHRLATSSDSEIALHLYEDHGTECLQHLNGEFAFVLWDESRRRLFAARDRFGVKPLYYARIGATLYLASEAKALFAAGVPAAWDHEAVFQDLSIVSDPDRTIFQAVRQVPPGHYLLATDHETKIVCYWDLDYPRLDDEPARSSDGEHVEELRAALVEATRLRLRADVPVGCYLSGGIDSATVLGIAQSLRANPIDAFTIAFEEPRFDEAPIAEETARHVGAIRHRFPVSEALLADHYADAVAQSETISHNANAVAKYLLSERVRGLGYKVVLTGEGADEILGGYTSFRGDLTPQDPPPGTEGVHAALGFVPGWIRNAAWRQTRLRPLLAPSFLDELRDRDPFCAMLDRLDVRGQCAGREPLHQAMYLWSKTVFPQKILNFLGDRMEMAHSVEGRLPFLDHHVVELANRMPASMKIRGAIAKHALREAARPYVTETVYRRRKHPFVAPFSPKGKLNQRMQDTLRSEAFRSVPFFEPAAVIRMIDGMPAMEDPEERDRLFGLLMMALSSAVLQSRYRL